MSTPNNVIIDSIVGWRHITLLGVAYNITLHNISRNIVCRENIGLCRDHLSLV
jgi:hypothetical protein